MDPMQPPEPVLPSLPRRSTPIQPGGFPGWGAGPVPPPPPPGAPGWAGSPMPYGMPPATRTHGLATAALVCGLIGLATFWLIGIMPLLGLIFGLISARTIKQSNGTLTGLGKARAGWITGFIGVAGAALFFTAIALDWIDTDTGTDTAATDYDNNPATRPYIEAKVGDCVGTIPEEDVVYELEFVSCDVAHTAEVYLSGKLNPGGTRDYPGDATLLDEVDLACTAAFEAYVGRTYERSVFEIFYLYPRAFGWKPEEGIYFCFLGEVGKTSVGSAFHSDR